MSGQGLNVEIIGLFLYRESRQSTSGIDPGVVHRIDLDIFVGKLENT